MTQAPWQIIRNIAGFALTKVQPQRDGGWLLYIPGTGLFTTVFYTDAEMRRLMRKSK